MRAHFFLDRARRLDDEHSPEVPQHHHENCAEHDEETALPDKRLAVSRGAERIEDALDDAGDDELQPVDPDKHQKAEGERDLVFTEIGEKKGEGGFCGDW